MDALLGRFWREKSMKLLIEVEDEFIPSQEYFLSSVDNKKKFGVVFEIDSETAYFYAVKMSKRSKNLKEIFDACHIFLQVLKYLHLMEQCSLHQIRGYQQFCWFQK